MYRGPANVGKEAGLNPPSVPGQPKLRPATPTLISSHVFCPTSLMNIVPVPGWNVNVNGLRSPAAQIAAVCTGYDYSVPGAPRDCIPQNDPWPGKAVT